MVSTDSRIERDIALNLKKVFRVFAGLSEDMNEQNDAGLSVAFSEESCSDATRFVGYTMKGPST